MSKEIVAVLTATNESLIKLHREVDTLVKDIAAIKEGVDQSQRDDTTSNSRPNHPSIYIAHAAASPTASSHEDTPTYRVPLHWKPCGIEPHKLFRETSHAPLTKQVTPNNADRGITSRPNHPSIYISHAATSPTACSEEDTPTYRVPLHWKPCGIEPHRLFRDSHVPL